MTAEVKTIIFVNKNVVNQFSCKQWRVFELIVREVGCHLIFVSPPATLGNEALHHHYITGLVESGSDIYLDSKSSSFSLVYSRDPACGIYHTHAHTLTHTRTPRVDSEESTSLRPYLPSSVLEYLQRQCKRFKLSLTQTDTII